MTWPAVMTKANFDAAGDDPKLARSELATNVDLFNQAQAHVSSFGQSLIDDADAAAARTTLSAQTLDATLTSLAAVAGVAGDVLYASGTDAWARLAKGTDGEVLTLASGIPSWATGGATLVIKTADETVTSSTTLQNDDHLLFALAANKTYLVKTTLLISATDANPKFKCKWTVPTSCTMFWGPAGGSQWGGVLALNVETDTLTNIAVPASTTGLLYLALVRNGANAGNLQFQWAQENSDASDTKVLKHSSLTIREMGTT